jgi:hypothetical protein
MKSTSALLRQAMTVGVGLGSVTWAPYADAAPVAAPEATASTLRVAVTPVAFSGIDDPSRRKLLAQSLAAGLGSGGAALVPGAAPPCGSEACWAELVGGLEVDYAVEATIEFERRIYRMRLGLRDRAGTIVAESLERCEVCGISDASTLLRDQAAALWAKLEDLSLAPPSLELRSVPDGAAVELDGRPVGTTPLSLQVGPGRRRLRATKSGFRPATRDVDAMSGTRERITFELAALAPQAPRPAHRRRLVAVAWTSPGIAVGAAAAGGTLLALDGRPARTRCSGDDRDAFGSCRYLHETTVAGAVMLSTAAVSAVSAVVFAAIVRRRGRGAARLPRTTGLP